MVPWYNNCKGRLWQQWNGGAGQQFVQGQKGTTQVVDRASGAFQDSQLGLLLQSVGYGRTGDGPGFGQLNPFA